MLKFTRVLSHEEADADAFIVTLFVCPLNMVRGWMVGPISMLRDGVEIPYVAPSVKMLGILAVLRAHKLAERAERSVYIVDPDSLWERLVRP